MRDGRPIYVESAYAAAAGPNLVLLGQPTFIWESDTVFADSSLAEHPWLSSDSLAGVLLDAKGMAHPIRLPEGVLQMLSPRAAWGNGALHVVWGTSADTLAGMSAYASALWYARFDGTHWTHPERILEAKGIWWNSTTPPLTMVAGTPQLAISGWERESSPLHLGVAYIRQVDGHWRTSWLTHTDPLATDIALVAGGQGSVVIAYVGSIIKPRGKSELNVVAVMRSVDSGEIWSPPHAVRLFSESLGHGLQLLGSATGRMQIAWAVDDADPREGGRIGRAVSDDGGRSWLLLPDAPLARAAEAMTGVLVDSTVYLAARAAGTDSLFAMSWTGADSLAVQHLPFEPAESLPRLSVIGRDSLMLVWGVTRPNSYPLFPGIDVPLLLTSNMVIHCW